MNTSVHAKQNVATLQILTAQARVENNTHTPLTDMFVSHKFSHHYRINKTESPATRRFALTKTLHPVVRRCLFG